MCGIVAYRGIEQASGILLDGLKVLEYRGYDSAGIGVLNDGKITVRKAAGKVGDVDEKLGFRSMKGVVGIAHTRWATSGSVSDVNAHPHISSDGKMAIVQNGIVENYQELRDALKKQGHKFVSETDTEVILALVVQERKKHDLLSAVQRAFLKLRGRNAFVILDSSGVIVAAKKGSPLTLGVCQDALFLASDASPLLAHTRDVVFIDDDEIVQLDDTYRIYDAVSLKEKRKKIDHINWTVEQAQKGSYEHFMLKEIMEQRESIAASLVQDRATIESAAKMINEAFGTYAVGCGTAGKVALTATYLFSKISKKHMNFAIGSEFPSYHDFLTKKSLLLAISQSGETADTLEAVDVLKQINGKVLAIVNVRGSTMDRVADKTILVNAGPEIAVCSTKATTGQLAIVTLLAYACAGKYDEGIRTLKQTALSVEKMLSADFLKRIRDIAGEIVKENNMYIIGRGLNYPMALEAAIKIQEVSYIHAEGFAGGELKHGPIALIEKGTPLIALVANDEAKDDTISNALEVKSRGGYIIGISPENNEVFDQWIKVPDLPETSPIVNIIPVQLLAYHLAVARGTDVDQPKNLAKSVTVK